MTRTGNGFGVGMAQGSAGVRGRWSWTVLLLALAMLVSCKLVNTHVVKLTSTPEVEANSDVLVKTTKGNVHFSAATLSQGTRELLLGMHPYQCLAIKTSEQFAMDSGNVRFTDFKLTKLVESAPECRKVRSGTRLFGN